MGGIFLSTIPHFLFNGELSDKIMGKQHPAPGIVCKQMAKCELAGFDVALMRRGRVKKSAQGTNVPQRMRPTLDIGEGVPYGAQEIRGARNQKKLAKWGEMVYSLARHD